MHRDADRSARVARVGVVLLLLGAAFVFLAALTGVHVYRTPVYTSTPPPTPSPGALDVPGAWLALPPAPTEGAPGAVLRLLLPIAEVETPGASPTASATASATAPATTTPTRTATATASVTPSPSPTAPVQPSATDTPTHTATATATATSTASATAPRTATRAPHATATASASATPSRTQTPTLTQTPSLTPSPTGTDMPSRTATPSPTGTATPSPTLTPTATRTPTPTITVTPGPTATRHPPARLRIPAIDLDAPVTPVSWEALEIDGQWYGRWQVPDAYTVGWHDTSAGVGEVGNTVLNGHHNRYGRVFMRLIRVQPGDEVELVDDATGAVHRYIVVRTMVLPEEGQPVAQRLENARWILPTPDERVTLVSCWPYDGNSHRLIVVALPASAVLAMPTAAPATLASAP